MENIKIGKKLDNNMLHDIFSVSTQGGIRKSNKESLIVLIQKADNSIYPDEIDWDNYIINYIGTGIKGDQSSDSGLNKAIVDSKKLKNGMHFFVSYKENNKSIYLYCGKVDLIESKYINGYDDNGKLRKLVLFKLKFKDLDEKQINNIRDQFVSAKIDDSKKESKKVKKQSDSDIIKKVKRSMYNHKNSNDKVLHKISNRIEYNRDPKLVLLAKRFSGGYCQLCENEAPFNDENEVPFLEVHHIDWLSNGGKDSIYNVIAICPNCHRKMHILKLDEDVNLLKNKAAKFAYDYGFKKKIMNKMFK